MHYLTTPEKQVLEIIQSDFPLTIHPYHAVGQQIGLSEEQVITSLKSLKTRKMLRQISAIFNGRFLGFDTALISFQIPEQALEYTAQVINSHPGVSHNYQREHRFNLWFTLSVPQELNVQQHMLTLARLTSCSHLLYLPSIKTFKRRVQFSMTIEHASSCHIFQNSVPLSKMSRKIAISEQIQYGIMQTLQQDLPLTPTPFADIACRFQITPETLFDFLAYLKSSKKMNRFAGIVYHRNLGFTANAMVVWNVSDTMIRSFARYASELAAVSHCYERLTYPEWPYNVYTMIHGRSQAVTQQVIDKLAQKFSLHQYEILYSSKEFKKQRVDFFDNAIYEWHNMYVAPFQDQVNT